MQELNKIRHIEGLINSGRVSTTKGLIKEFKAASLPQSTYYPLYKKLNK